MKEVMKTDKWTVLAGLAVIVITNVFALAGVAYNRGGEPDAGVELSERELSMWHAGSRDENSGLSLRLACRIERSDGYGGGYSCTGNPQWLDQAKLELLGINVPPADSDRYRRQRGMSSKEVFLVLEFDGEAYRRTLQRAEEELRIQQALLDEGLPGKALKVQQDRVQAAQNYLRDERNQKSRLFVVDAGLSKTRLRALYPDTGRYIMYRGLVNAGYYEGKSQQWRGTITDIPISHVNVPLAHRGLLDEFWKSGRRSRNEGLPRYAVQVSFGRRLEPWVEEVRAL